MVGVQLRGGGVAFDFNGVTLLANLLGDAAEQLVCGFGVGEGCLVAHELQLGAVKGYFGAFTRRNGGKR